MKKTQFNNMLRSLIKREAIKTTIAKAKKLKPAADRLINIAKENSLHARRRIVKPIQDKQLISKLFNSIVPRFENRNGGYLRLTRIGFRKGDGAPMALLEFIDRPKYKKKEKKKEKEKPK